MTTSEPLIITREFDAPKEIVWKAMTDTEIMKRWWGPETFTAPIIRSDFRVGGKYHFCMRSPEGKDYWSTGEYKEIIPFKKIVNTDSFADADGNVISASEYGMGSDWPDALLVTFDFEETDGKTTMSAKQEGIPSPEMFEESRKGWDQSFDKLEKVIEEIKND